MLCRIVDLNVFVDVLKAVQPDTGRLGQTTGRFHLVRSFRRTMPDRVLMMPHYNGIRVVDADAVRMNPVEIEQ